MLLNQIKIDWNKVRFVTLYQDYIWFNSLHPIQNWNEINRLLDEHTALIFITMNTGLRCRSETKRPGYLTLQEEEDSSLDKAAI